MFKKIFKSILLFIFSLSEENKNEFIFMDIPNLLDQFLIFNPLLVNHVTLYIEDYISNHFVIPSEIFEFCENFYQNLYEEIFKNGYKEDFDYIVFFTQNKPSML